MNIINNYNHFAGAILKMCTCITVLQENFAESVNELLHVILSYFLYRVVHPWVLYCTKHSMVLMV